MATVYSVFSDGKISGTRIFRTLKEAKAYIKEYDIEEYALNRCKLKPITIESMLNIINSRGGCWCAGIETIKDTLND